jgi:photosystem II protein PsbQ
MKIFRPIFSLILVLAATILVSCSSSTASAPPTYTPDKLQQISTYRIPLDVARQRIPELGQYIANEDWVNANSFLHGPLGLMRRDLTYLSKALLPDEQQPALDMTKDIFKHIENIDVAVNDHDYQVAISQYKEMVSDLDVYAGLIPNSQKPVTQAEKAMKSTKNVFKGIKQEVTETVDEMEEIIPDSDDNA